MSRVALSLKPPIGEMRTKTTNIPRLGDPKFEKVVKERTNTHSDTTNVVSEHETRQRDESVQGSLHARAASVVLMVLPPRPGKNHTTR